MSAPSKPNKPKKVDKTKKGEAARAKKKKSGGSNLQIILAVVGVVVLLGVGLALYFIFSGGGDNKPLAGNTNPGAKRPVDGGVPGGGSGEAKDETPAAAAPDLTSSLAKADELADKLSDEKTRDDASKSLRQLLETDAVRKGTGRQKVLERVKDKALAGNKGAEDFLRSLAKDPSNPALALIAGNLVKESFPQESGAAIAAGEDPTNYLPAKTDVVFRVFWKRFLDSEYSKGVIGKVGAYQRADFDRRLGMDTSAVDQIVIGGLKDYGHAVGIVRTSTPYNWDELRTNLGVSGDGVTVKGRTYFIGKIDFLTEFLGKRIPGLQNLASRAAFWRADPNTLVYSDEASIKDLIENPPEKRSVTPSQTASNPGQGGAGGGAAATPPGTGGGGGGGFGAAPPINDNPGGRAGGGAATPPGVGDGNTPPQGGTPPPPPPVGGGGGAQEAPEESLDSKGTKFLTLDTKFRRLINFTEDPSNESLLFYADSSTTKVPVVLEYLYFLSHMPKAKAQDVDMIALALPPTTGQPTLRVGLGCRSRSQAQGVFTELEKLLAQLGKGDLKDLFGFEFGLKGASTTADNNQSGGFGGGGAAAPGGGFNAKGAGGGGGFGAPPGVGGGTPPPPPPVGPGGVGAGGGGAVGGANKGRGATGGGGGFNTPPGAGGAPGGGNQSQADEPDTPGKLEIERSTVYILITATVKSSLSDFSDKHVGSWMTQVRGNQEMAGGRFRFGDLAHSLTAYRDDLAKQSKPFMFPYGAYPRAADGDRGGRPFPATERVSFLRELLPYLGDDRFFTLKDAINPELSWRDTSGSPSNAESGRILVPQFLNPMAGSETNFVKVRGVPHSMATTHFVGMAGVGPDAANYPKSDPRAGIMGYNRQTSHEDIKDGLSNTIYMIEADKAALGPWLAGGGATVRGTSDAGNDVGRKGGFSSPAFGGKQGVWVLMADGSARFITKDISPEVFKALCTMAGSDTTGPIDLIGARQTLETTQRGVAAKPGGAGKKRTEEEEVTPSKK